MILDPQLRSALHASRTSREPLLISLVPERFEDGAWSGVPRFDWELRKALPELSSLRCDVWTRGFLRWLAWRRPDAIVITGNESSLLVPARLRTVVVHHGCAQTHFDRDPEWRGRRARRTCRAQAEMYRRPNRWFVAPAQWAAEQFSVHHGVPRARVIAHWVETIAREPQPDGGPRGKLVLGDFRNFNKGRDELPRVAALVPEFELRPLRCTYETRKAAYAAADGYLNLSLSEGSSFALCDAEAAALPLVTTDVGNFDQFPDAEVIAWQDRDRPELVAAALRRALARPRGRSVYERFDLASWRAAWRELLREVAASPSRPALRD